MNKLASTISILVMSSLGASHVAADLIGVTPANPLFEYDSGGTSTFTAVDGVLVINSFPVTFTNSTGVTGDIFAAPTPIEVQVTIGLDSACGQATGNPSGDDLSISGDVFFDFADAIPDHSGTLVTGELIETGFATPNGSVDTFDMRFTVTGGTLVTDGEYAVGEELGMVLTIENSGFAGNCTVDWNGGAKGQVGHIDSAPMQGDGTGTLGYWKNHPEAWPVTSLTIAGVTYSQAQLLDLMQTKTKGDKTISMVKQLIPALLNVAAGNDGSCITGFIAAADDWLTVTGVGTAERKWDAGGPDGDLIHDELDAYNNGLLCAPHRD